MKHNNLFMGANGFVWWFGIVENNGDPLGLGRCQIRISGWDNENIDSLPTHLLPWAYPIMPITNGGVGGIGQSPVGIQVGSRVLGFFLDGEIGQQPVYFGVVGGESVLTHFRKLESGSTPWQPNLENSLFDSPFTKEGDCPDGYVDGQTNASQNTVSQIKEYNIEVDSGEWVIPYTGFVSSAYGPRGSSSHRGVDICPAGFFKQDNPGAPHLRGRLRGVTGLPVVAAADGKVINIWTADKGQGGNPTTYDINKRGSRSYGNAIAIQHNLSTGDYVTIYAHLGISQDPKQDQAGAGINVRVGDTVKKGQTIGYVGRSHCWDSLTHLHFEIRLGTALPKANNHINPSRIFPQLATIDSSFLTWANNPNGNYDIDPPYKLSDAPCVAGQAPKV